MAKKQKDTVAMDEDYDATLDNDLAALDPKKEGHIRMTVEDLPGLQLGEARGSGYTSGVDYLSEWLDHRLFWRLPGIGVTDTSRRSA